MAKSGRSLGVRQQQHAKGDAAEGEREAEEVKPARQGLQEEPERRHRAQLAALEAATGHRRGVTEAEGVGPSRWMRVAGDHPPFDAVGSLLEGLILGDRDDQLAVPVGGGPGDAPAARREDVNATAEWSYRLVERDSNRVGLVLQDTARRRHQRDDRGVRLAGRRQERPGRHRAEDRGSGGGAGAQ